MIRGLSITRRLALLTAAAILVVGTLTGVALRELALWNAAATQLARESREASLDGIFHGALTRATGEAVSYAVTGKQEYAQEAAEALLYAQSALNQLRRLGAERPPSATGDQIRRLRQEQEGLFYSVRRAVTQSLRTQPSVEVMPKERLERIYEPEGEVDRTWQEVIAWHDNEQKVLNRALRTHRDRVLVLVAATILASLLWSILIHVIVRRELLAPVRRRVQAADRIAEGAPDVRVTSARGDDPGALHESLDRIAQDLRQPSGSAPREPESGEFRPFAAAEMASPAPDAEQPAVAAPRRALLLAADPADRDLTRAMLQHCGLAVTLAEGDARGGSGSAAGCDVIVIDSGAGGSAADAISVETRPRYASGRVIPAIILAPGGEAAATPRWFLPGTDAQLTRPFSFFDLHAVLQRALGEA